jgi:hypothetical protein
MQGEDDPPQESAPGGKRKAPETEFIQDVDVGQIHASRFSRSGMNRNDPLEEPTLVALEQHVQHPLSLKGVEFSWDDCEQARSGSQQAPGTHAGLLDITIDVSGVVFDR